MEDFTGKWSLVVPLKPLAVAKSRLAAAAGAVRPALALAFALDTVAAALGCAEVGAVTVVTDDPVAGAELAALGALVVADEPAAGLNAALRHGAGHSRRRAGDAPVAALNGDLPALRPAELGAVLRAAAGAGTRAFLADAAGTGTTLLAAPPGVDLSPAFGGPSRARHLATGAREITLPTVPTVRQDVDTPEDLRAAVLLGVGPRTAAALPGLVIAD
ncbi:2-phospho-L-lactate guanylyltransferase [Actinacidiphila acididurans]|uniref:Phosphoenolpyruvate guanylyltransferase n=1 Tax=Actinacidiphila acididurans TaxID=2784346 RepID=A0ABS2TKM4_9ACTN|nr:2-phospho-L-lactate guanylyltransferase [Actinacidiphila acididurans]MBM9503883.1 2-phospho-L-lactate guanylyltransferase [Actinacidiphila acididurans]